MELTLALTHACDLACDYCFAGKKDARTLTPETGRRGIALALAAAKERGEGLDVSFLGGEPLLRFELLVELASDARAQGETAGVPVRLQVTTNGTRLTPERAAALDALAMHVTVSVDGTPWAQDVARPTVGGGRSSEAVARGLDAALEGCRASSTITVVDPRTVRRLDEGVAWLYARGVRRLTLNPAWSARWTDDDRAAWAEQYALLARRWVDAHRAGDPFFLSTIDLAVRARVMGASGPCGSGCGAAGIALAPSGRVYGCGRAIGEDQPGLSPAEAKARGFLGDVASCTLESACDARGPALPAECAVCPLVDRCGRTCACTNRETSGDPDVPGPLLCWHERMAIPLADRAAGALFAERDPTFLRRFYGARQRLPEAPTEVVHA